MKNFWHKCKNLIGKYFGWSIVGIIFAFIIPIGINWAYKTPASSPMLAMEWEAKDVLSFYGSLLGAAATIFALIATIKFTVESQRKERRLSIKPRLYSKWKDYSSEFLTISEEDNFVFVEFSANGVMSTEIIPKEILNILTNQRKVDASSYNIHNEMQEYLHEKALSSFKDSYNEYLNNHFLILYEIYNYGAENAIEVEFKINNSIVYPAFCVTTSKPQKFMLIFSEDVVESNNEDTVISLTYTDICSLGKYKQEERFCMFKADNKFHTTQAFEYKLSSPQEL